MMKTRFFATLGSLAVVAFLASAVAATELTFDGHSNNEDMSFDYGSNIGIGDNSAEFITTGLSGATPDVGLSWGPSDHTNVLEFHNSANWIAPMDGGKLQFDIDASGQPDFPPAPTIDFSVPAGVSVVLNSVIIGNAKDQHIDDGHEPAYDWTISLIRLSDSATVFSHTTTALGVATQGTGGSELVNINYTGDPGVSYQLLFDDGGDDSLYPSNHDGTIGNTPRGGIDMLSFSQSPRPVPEPSTLLLLSGCGLALLPRRKRS